MTLLVSIRNTELWWKVGRAPASSPMFHLDPVQSKINYLVNESDGAIDMHYAYLFALQGGVTTHTQACAVLGHKFADLREAKGRWRPWAQERRTGRRPRVKQEKKEEEAVQVRGGGKLHALAPHRARLQVATATRNCSRSVFNSTSWTEDVKHT